MPRILPMLLCCALLATACADPAIRRMSYDAPEQGTVVGSIFVELERRKRSTWDGFFESNLEARDPSYEFHFVGPDGTKQRVRAQRGEVRHFVIALPPGEASVEKVELRIYDSPASRPLGWLSTVDGKEFPIGLEFTVDPSRITYIGRIHVRLPKKLQVSSRPRFGAVDAWVEDRDSMGALVDHSPLPVETVLARRAESE